MNIKEILRLTSSLFWFSLLTLVSGVSTCSRRLFSAVKIVKRRKAFVYHHCELQPCCMHTFK